ncbi:Ypt/Rab-GAP domain of gyp1p superfamily protein [Rhynchospora pubera]|uniref:Ypt/Rab-GAP domain of gyp1p superfamily protein n=1 Tax=Rhynchospora pubera TaxID=906938 RepID=A0AAV8GN91_9POAL|nr:Ypt/Rab-GAP domain of gyp1p superfamily protein [Rhynchospora pubera]
MKALRRASTSSGPTSSPPPPEAASSPPTTSSAWVHLRSLLVVASSSSSSSSSSSPSVSSPLAAERGGLKSPWSRRKRRRVLSTKQWSHLFLTNGRLRDGGAKFLKRVRSGGVDPAIRSEVWPFLLGVYDLNSSQSERNITKAKNRKEYEKLRRQCRLLANQRNSRNGLTAVDELGPEEFNFTGITEAPPSPITQEVNPNSYFLFEDMRQLDIIEEEEDKTDSESSDSESSDEEDSDNIPLSSVDTEEEPKFTRTASQVRGDFSSSSRTSEDFMTWQRIIRLDALRTSPEWVLHSLKQVEVSEEEASQAAYAVGLKDYDHLDACMVYHAARMVAILEAYAIYDAETGYCQGMSDLLSPIVAIMEDDSDAFWCFVGFMRKARHNFRLDEAGIRRQLKIVSRIIQCKDSHLYKHLEKLQAEDCFFVYRMVVVLFRRELTFEQTVCLWEVMWADQAAVRAGIGLSAWARIRLRAPPTDDLLLYAIAACVLQKRKLIIEKYSSMDEILRECNSMAGQLDVWRLLDDAHDLVVNLHDRI